MSFLDPTIIAKLDSMPLRARVVIEGALTGLHRARLQGSSIEFSEHKEYSPGDEIRHMDWKAYGKFDRYYVKRYEQESELTCFLLLDATGSMGYGSSALSKLEYGSMLSAALAYLLIHQRDRVGLVAFGDESVTRYIPPRARSTHLYNILNVIEELNQLGASGYADLCHALDRVFELAGGRRSLIVLVSDLFDRSHALPILRRMRARGHDVVVFQVLDPNELEFPFRDLTIFRSLEVEKELLVDPSTIRKQYLRKMDEFLQSVRRECVNGGVEYHLVRTTQPLERTVRNFLTARGATRIGRRT